MTKTFLYGLVVAIEPKRGGAVLVIELDPAAKPVRRFEAGEERAGVVRKLAETKRVKLTPAAWQNMKRERSLDDILLARVALDQEPLRFAFLEPGERPPITATAWWSGALDVRSAPCVDLDFINDHREAVGRPKFRMLSDAAAKKHLALIEKHAPFGEDPWGDA